MRDSRLSDEAQWFIAQEMAERAAAERKKMLAIVAAILSITVGFFGYSIKATSDRSAKELLDSIAVQEIDKRLEDVRRQSQELQAAFRAVEQVNVKQLDEIVAAIEAVPELQSSSNSKEVAARLAKLSARIQELDEKNGQVNALIAALGNDASKTLAVPILRKDLDALNERVDALSANIAKEMSALRGAVSTETGRIYDLGKWFLGLILAVSVIPIIEPFFARRKRAAEIEAKSQPAASPEDAASEIVEN